MRVLRRVLFGIGVALLALYAFTHWLNSSSTRFAQAQSAFINQFVSDLSQRWDLADVTDRVGGALALQADNADGQRRLAQFKPLGSLRSISQLQLQRYALSDDATSGVFWLRAQFTHGGAQIQITLTERHDTVRVESLYLKPLVSSDDPALPQIDT